jgi:hypothetical protein
VRPTSPSAVANPIAYLVNHDAEVLCSQHSRAMWAMETSARPPQISPTRAPVGSLAQDLSGYFCPTGSWAGYTTNMFEFEFLKETGARWRACVTERADRRPWIATHATEVSRRFRRGARPARRTAARAVALPDGDRWVRDVRHRKSLRAEIGRVIDVSDESGLVWLPAEQ